MSISSETRTGSPRSFLPLIEPSLEGNEWEYVRECVETGWVSSAGRFVDRFEHEFASWLGTSNAVAVSSGTAALHLALLVAGVRPGDTVIVPTLTFIAPVNAIRYCAAKPAFLDAEPDYWQMDVAQLEKYLSVECNIKNGQTYERASGSRVAAVLPVHILGHPVDMDPLISLAEQYHLRVIEDATESLGATYKGIKAGLLGDMACFSFNGNKLITTGGGGMIVSKYSRLAERARHLSTQAKADPVEYIHDEVGYNYRLTNIQAALGCAQLEQIDDFLQRKRAIRTGYEKALEEVHGIQLQGEANWARSANWLISARFRTAAWDGCPRPMINRLRDFGIQTRPLWQPLHASKPHGQRDGTQLPVATRLYREGISLPSSVALAGQDIERVSKTLREII